jgi:hypothetical protein
LRSKKNGPVRNQSAPCRSAGGRLRRARARAVCRSRVGHGSRRGPDPWGDGRRNTVHPLGLLRPLDRTCTASDLLGHLQDSEGPFLLPRSAAVPLDNTPSSEPPMSRASRDEPESSGRKDHFRWLRELRRQVRCLTRRPREVERYSGAIAGAVLDVLTSVACVPAATASAFTGTTRRLLAGFARDVDLDAATSVLLQLAGVRSLPHGDFRSVLQTTCSALPSNTRDVTAPLR